MNFEINNLIANAKISQAIDTAIQLYPKKHNELILLKSRYSALSWKRNLGQLTYSEDNTMTAQITSSLFVICDGNDDEYDVSPKTAHKREVSFNYAITPDALISRLEKVSESCQRRNRSIGDAAETVVDELIEYKRKKRQSPTYDKESEGLKVFSNKVLDIESEFKNAERKKEINTAEKIANELDGDLTKEKIIKAYGWAQSKGYQNSFINLQLNNPILSLDALEDCADMLDNFARTL